MAWHELMDHFCNNNFLLVYFYDYLFSEIKKDTGDSMWLNSTEAQTKTRNMFQFGQLRFNCESSVLCVCVSQFSQLSKPQVETAALLCLH